MLRANALDEELLFFKSGNPVQKKSAVQLKKLITIQTLTVYEPEAQSKKIYSGYPILELLQKVYGSSLLTDYDSVVFYAKDGYRADVPLSDLLKKKALLAFALKDQQKFELKTTSGKIISLAPYYLAWDHPDAASVAKDFFRWPYQIVKIDLIQSQTIQTALLKQTHQQSLEGMRHFVQHCFSCHQYNGVGGQLGPPLNPLIPLWKSPDLVRFLLDPKKMRPSSSMSGLPQGLVGREQIAESIVLFLNSNSRSTPQQ